MKLLHLNLALRNKHAGHHRHRCPEILAARSRSRLNTALRRDPAHIRPLQARLIREMKRRLGALKRDIRVSIVDNDCFGLQTNESPFPLVIQEAVGYKSFSFPTAQQKVDAFLEWLRGQEAKGVLDIKNVPARGLSAIPGWSHLYVDSYYQKSIREAYLKGVENAANNLAASGVPSASLRFSVEGSFFQPIHVDKIGMIYSRTYEDLKSVMDVMNGTIRRELADALSTGLARGLAEGKGPAQIARELATNVTAGVDKIGQARLLMIARTETARAQHVASITEYRQAGIEGVTVLAEWQDSGLDQPDNPCEDCKALSGQVFSLDVIEGMIPLHPNCCCSMLPVVKDFAAPDSYVPEAAAA